MGPITPTAGIASLTTVLQTHLARLAHDGTHLARLAHDGSVNDRWGTKMSGHDTIGNSFGNGDRSSTIIEPLIKQMGTD